MFIPIGDENRRGSRPPYVVSTLIVLNVGVFAYQWHVGSAYGVEALVRFIYDFGAVPTQVLGEFPRPLGLLTSMFLHADLFHLLGNMLFLWIFADNIEDLLGSPLFLVFYLLCGVASEVASVYARIGSPNPNIPGIGASGAIAGVMGAYFAMFPYNRIRTFYWLWFYVGVAEIAAIWYLGIWVVWQFLLQGISASMRAVGGVDYMAHLTGFIVGMLLVAILPKNPTAVRARHRVP